MYAVIIKSSFGHNKKPEKKCNNGWKIFQSQLPSNYSKVLVRALIHATLQLNGKAYIRVVHQASAYPGFSSIKPLGVFLLLL